MEWNWISILWAFSYLIRILALFIIPANYKPGKATAWLLLIFLAPIVGAILFLHIELAARVTGPVVRELNAAFGTDWYSETEELFDASAAPEIRVRTPATGDALCQVLPSGRSKPSTHAAPTHCCWRRGIPAHSSSSFSTTWQG